MTRFTAESEIITNYIHYISLRESEKLRKLREETYEENSIKMQSSPEQVQFICFLLKLIQAKNIIEIGIYKGYSTMAFAESLPEDGEIIACEKNTKNADIAVKYWKKAGIDNKIKLRLAPALDTLQDLVDSGRKFDAIFIDADKANYINYYELSLKLVKEGGIIIIDNTLWDGKVLDENAQDKQTISIKNLNQILKNDERIDITMLPIRDGLTILRKKDLA